MDALLKNLTLDYWYKMLIFCAIGLAFLALTKPLLVVQNGIALIFAIGMLVTGIGEWINHPHEGSNVYDDGRALKNARAASVFGTTMLIIGCAIMAIAVAFGILHVIRS